MLKSLIRLNEFVHRFLVGVHNWGLQDALKVFFIYRKKISPQPISIFLKGPHKYFFFRGAADRGVISHFYKPGYRIREAANAPKIQLIIDAGANIGDETIRFRHFHPEARIIALEAEKNNYALLQKNTVNDPNVITLHNGLWSHACKLKIVSGNVNEDFHVEEVAETNTEYDLIQDLRKWAS